MVSVPDTLVSYLSKASGSHSVTCVPRPMVLVISTPPPCSSTIFSTTGNPNPETLGAVERLEDLTQLVVRNSGAIVRHNNFHPLAVDFGGDDDLVIRAVAVSLHGLTGVVVNVDDGTPQAVPVEGRLDA